MHTSISSQSARSVDLLFAKRKVIAPRSVHDIITERPRWPKLVEFEPNYQDGTSLLYDLASLKPTQSYTADPRNCVNTVVYLNVLLNTYDKLQPIVSHLKTIGSLSVWASPLIAEPAERTIIPSVLDEELFLALYAVGAHLMFLVVDQSDYMQQEKVLKSCVVILNTCAHIWRTLHEFIEHNQHFEMFASHGGFENLCFSTEILFQLTRAQLCEMWVLYYRMFGDVNTRSETVQAMMFRTAMEYGMIETKLTNNPSIQADCILAGPFPPGALLHIAGIKHQYYLADAADQIIDRAADLGTLQGQEPMALYIWRTAKEAGEAIIKRSRSLDTKGSLWTERMDVMATSFIHLNTQHLDSMGLLSEKGISTFAEASREQAVQVKYTDLFGETFIPLRQLETDQVDYNSPVFQQTAVSLCATINECMLKLKRDLPALAQIFDTKERIRVVSDGLLNLLNRHPKADTTEVVVPTASTMMPQEITEFFADRMHLWTALKRLGMCTKFLMTYNQTHPSSALLNLLNGQITALIEMTQLIFYPRQPLAIDDLIELARNVSESIWAQLVMPRMRRFIVDAQTNYQVGNNINMLTDAQEKIRKDFVIYKATNAE